MVLDKKLRRLRNKCWRLLSKKIRRERGNKCQFPGCESTIGLNVHHIEDARLNPVLFLDEKNLLVLCVRHHKFSRDAIHRSGTTVWKLLVNVVGLPIVSYLMYRKYEEFRWSEEYLLNKLKEIQDNTDGNKEMAHRKQRKTKRIKT